MKTMILAALAALSVPTQIASSPPDEQLFTAIRAALDAELLDYPSTRFKDVVADDSVVCGSLNAKNRMGAYTGWTRFGAYKGSNGIRLFVDDPQTTPLMLDLYCGDDRQPVSRDYSDRLTHR